MGIGNIIIVNDFSSLENIFFVIFLLALYFHGAWIAAFFLGYVNVSNSSTPQKIKNIWKVIVTFFIYQMAVYSIITYFGRYNNPGWPYLSQVAEGLRTMTGIEFLLIFAAGIYLSIRLRSIQKMEEDPYALLG